MTEGMRLRTHIENFEILRVKSRCKTIASSRVEAMVFNGVSHVLMGVALRRYNPGLYTSLFLFLPWGVFLIFYFSSTVPSSLVWNVVGLLTGGFLLHAIILVHVFRRRRALLSPAGGEISRERD